MTPELQRYYEDRIAMMGEKAWRDLVEDVENMLKASDTVNGLETIEQLHFRKGELSIMRWILNLEAVSRDTYDQLMEEKNAGL